MAGSGTLGSISPSNFKVFFDRHAKPGDMGAHVDHVGLGHILQALQEPHVVIHHDRVGAGIIPLYDDNGTGALEEVEAKRFITDALNVIKDTNYSLSYVKLGYLDHFGTAVTKGQLERDAFAKVVETYWESNGSTFRRARHDAAVFDYTISGIVDTVFASMGFSSGPATAEKFRAYLWKQGPTGDLMAEIRKLMKVPLAGKA